MRKRLENNLQADCVKWFNNNYCLTIHNPRCFIFSVQNEMASQISGALKQVLPKSVWSIIDKTCKIILGKAVTFGFRKGVSDLVVVLPNKTLYVELKTETGKQREEQEKFENIVKDLEHEYHLVRDLETFKNIIYANINI